MNNHKSTHRSEFKEGELLYLPKHIKGKARRDYYVFLSVSGDTMKLCRAAADHVRRGLGTYLDI